MRKQIIGMVAAFVAATSFPASSIAQEQVNGPSSLSETYEDWTVGCTGQGAERSCSFSQWQARQDGRRVLGVELVPAKEGDLKGTLVLPFGLALNKGVVFAIDDMPPGKPSVFKTCLPVGCVVPFTFPAVTTKAFRTGVALKLVTVASDSGKGVTFSISLKGFAAALDRTTALMQ